MPDELTATNALLTGEIDYIENMPYDLLPMIEGKDGFKIEVLDRLGLWSYYRFNFLHPPFNNKLIRRAAMAAVGQDDLLKALTGNPKYLDMAVTIANYVNGYWDTSTCGGGVWWNAERTYKNAVTNGLWIRLTAELHNRIRGDKVWLARSRTAWAWFTGSGMINANGLVNDGLTDACDIDGICVDVGGIDDEEQVADDLHGAVHRFEEQLPR